jgi:peroxiredoxin
VRRGARLVILLAIAVAIVLTLTACAPEDAQTSPGYVSGDGTVTILDSTEQARVVELTGTSYAGDQVDVADYRGQVVVLNTWYASCPPCRAEAEDLVALDGQDGVQLIGINSRDDAGTAQAFERTFDVEYPSIDDTGGGAIAALQGLVAVNAVPTSIVLDPEGRVYARVLGRVEPSTLESLVADAAQVVDDA